MTWLKPYQVEPGSLAIRTEVLVDIPVVHPCGDHIERTLRVAAYSKERQDVLVSQRRPYIRLLIKSLSVRQRITISHELCMYRKRLLHLTPSLRYLMWAELLQRNRFIVVASSPDHRKGTIAGGKMCSANDQIYIDFP